MTYPDRPQPGAAGEPRKAHYGDGEQPWDAIVRLGWGPAFAAGNVLKYLRRTKDPEHSLESARWYWRRLEERFLDDAWHEAAERLANELTYDELQRLADWPKGVPKTFPFRPETSA